MNIPGSITTLLIGILLTVVSIWYGQNHGLMPVEASEEASRIDGLFNMMITIGTGLFLIVQGTLIYSLFKFRRRPDDDTDGPYVEGNIPLEILWTSIPAVIVLIIAVYSFDVYNSIGGLNPMDHSVAHGRSTHQVARMPGAAIAAPLPEEANAPLPEESDNLTGDRSPQVEEAVTQDPATTDVRDQSIPQRKDSSAMGATVPRIGSTPGNVRKPPEYVINATGLQFAWLFTYPDTGIVAGELHVPVGKEILLNISANDVLHAFWVPEYRLKQDAIPGKQTELRFTPSKVGEYPVICAELCGAYHGVMKTKVIAQTQEDFDAWLKEQQVASNPDSLKQAVAVTPANQTPDEFLAPFVRNLGIDRTVVEQLHPEHHTHSSAS
ncbi:heme/copper-type cytochrome/quinol oxidase, subunit 2 [Leptolyngbyaceae cyanobacterium JSC-12]|nr:heme/copper-type cytochrome/quinol oxidase, subunit 2 [Leptolyngbyaceae cyanobacterium JSC-12]